VSVKEDLISLSDYVFDRTWHRLTGLGDAEYFWEPVAGCWSVRLTSGSAPSADWEPSTAVPPFTTIAWRLWHLTGCYGADRNELWLRGTSDGTGEERCAPREAASTALEALNAAHGWWRTLLAGLPEQVLEEPLGRAAGPYAEQSRTAFVLHQLDEQIHHGAELGVLRDLYASSQSE